ncbi:tetratricopeptide repeat protein [Aequorivita sp. F47161]|uniref:Tetratricopeptide repeat protein n=1 Tax=Aequorivita vitellina TaxID=2874475 RepID=A0A9X1QZ59_9FLAO|nr:tetratricopeptide repeat-containing sensor histidine kinase [Aequorivita vitellina]MCG2419743.1 tetratricopeptide repeat protein [Aequorivita vitellina]
MSTYYSTHGRAFGYALFLFLNLASLPLTAQRAPMDPDFEKHLNQALNDSLSLEVRKKHLTFYYNLVKEIQDDSLKYERISEIVEIASNLKDSVYFHNISNVGHKLALSINKPSFVGDSHWNYAAYYLNEKEYERSYDHYHHAYKLFIEANNDYYAGKMLYNMAYISSKTYDYTGAEILLFRSIKLFEQTGSTLQRYRSFNLLGTIADDMEEFEKGLSYYTTAANLIKELDKWEYNRLQNLNNLGVRLIKMKQFDEALSYFNEALSFPEILRSSPALLAKLLDNRAYCLISLGKHENVVSSMLKAIAIRDSIDDTSGRVISRLRFANYYGKIGDSAQAIVYAKHARELASENNLKRDVLHSLEFLAVYDRKNAVSYLERHIALNKKINAEDRNLRNKFTAIQYETETYIRKNERLLKQKLQLLLISLVSIAILLLIYLNTRQRAKNKQLLLERQEQQYNEDMYLMALAQKSNLEKGRAEERKRISQELHDGIISRLFALRFKWQTIKLSGEAIMLEQHRHFLNLLEELETDIRNLSHEFRNMLYMEDKNFLNGIKTLIKEKSEIGNFTFRFDYEQAEDWENIPFITKINVQRFFEEVLQNVIKHAQATEVTVSIYRDMKVLIFKITDNGKGFSQSQLKKGIGIKNLENRSSKLKGNLEVQSTLNVGTVICLCIPINN